MATSKDYKLEVNRLQTFHNWPTSAAVSPSDLAKAGFVYSGRDDRVQCVFCGGKLSYWESDDNPLAEHAINFPECPFLLDNRGAGNVPVGEENPYSSELRRLQTFKDWPIENLVKPRDLANAGFYYTGSGDRVQCAFCRGILLNWEQGDKAFGEHLKHFPKCPLIVSPLLVGNILLQDEVFGYDPYKDEEKRNHQQTERRHINRDYKNSTLSAEVDRIMGSHMAQTAISLCVSSENTMRQVIRKRLEDQGVGFQNYRSFIEAIHTYQDGNTADVDLAQYPTDYDELVAANERLREERLCKVCLDDVAIIVFLNCGHLVCCDGCAKKCPNCPICRQEIVGLIKVAN